MTKQRKQKETDNMTDTEATETAEAQAAEDDNAEATEDEGTTEAETAEAEGDGKGESLAAEARSWRKKYQAARAEVDTLAATVTGLQHQQVETMLAGKIADVADWWTAVDLAELLAEDGTVDPAKVSSVLAALLAAKPHWSPRRPNSSAAPASELLSNDKATFQDQPHRSRWSSVLSGYPSE